MFGLMFPASLKRTILGLIIAFVPALAVASELPKIGVLFPGPAGPAPSIQAFANALSELGYRDRQNIVIEYRYADGKFDRLPALAKELADLPVNVIVAVGGEALVATKRATDAIPIVSATGEGDFVAMGLIASWDQPGGNITGMNLSSAEAAQKRVEVFKQAVPMLARLAVLVHALYPASPQLLAVLESSATQHDIQVQPISVSTPEELEGAMAAAKQAGANAVMTLQGPFFFLQRKAVADLAAQHKLPLAMGEPLSAEAGALLQVNPDVPECAARAAAFVDRILKGAKPGDLPIERFSSTQVVFNLKAARDLGITIDPEVTRGGRVIE
jgi:putative ABC transport system substrate-binding protein